MSGMFKPVAFEQWRENQLEAWNAEADFSVDCHECDGTGETECCECGNERQCDNCDGKGTVYWSELTDKKRLNYLTRDRYYEAVLADAQAWAGWVCVDPIALLVAAGFSVYSTVLSRTLRVKELNS